MAVESRECRSAAYSRRHPEQTVLDRVVQQHLETYLLLAHEGNWDGHAVPAYVERDFRHYLECGILAYGFARAYCAECGHDFLVAFSCYLQLETMKSPEPRVQYLWDPPKDSLPIVSDRKARR